MVTIDQIKQLREETGLSISEVKKALEESKGDFNKAKSILASNADAIAKKKSDRATHSGLIEAYVHAQKIGVLLEIACESDFVAKNEDFRTLAHNLAMQIASMAPKDIEELMGQDYILDQSMKVENYVKSLIAKIRENIQIKRFVRFELGEEEK